MNFPPASQLPADAEARLDAALAAHPRTTPADFAARTLERARAVAAQAAALRAGDEHALDSLLCAHSIVPPADFVIRTLARIHAENELRAAAQAGRPDAVDALLDRWLAEQPIESDAAPEFAASQARREAARTCKPAIEPETPVWRRLLAFPTWVRPAAGLAAVMAIAFLVLRQGEPAAPVAENDWTPQPVMSKLPSPEAATLTASTTGTSFYDETLDVDVALLPDAAPLLEVEDFDTLAAMAANWSEEAY